jgi:hypothetical protein
MRSYRKNQRFLRHSLDTLQLCMVDSRIHCMDIQAHSLTCMDTGPSLQILQRSKQQSNPYLLCKVLSIRGFCQSPQLNIVCVVRCYRVDFYKCKWNDCNLHNQKDSLLRTGTVESNQCKRSNNFSHMKRIHKNLGR